MVSKKFLYLVHSIINPDFKTFLLDLLQNAPNIRIDGIKEILIKKPKKPAELKNIARKKEAIIKAPAPKYEPRVIAEKYMGISEKSSCKKGSAENIAILPKLNLFLQKQKHYLN